jgi:hypothetical protein
MSLNTVLRIILHEIEGFYIINTTSTTNSVSPQLKQILVTVLVTPTATSTSNQILQKQVYTAAPAELWIISNMVEIMTVVCICQTDA